MKSLIVPFEMSVLLFRHYPRRLVSSYLQITFSLVICPISFDAPKQYLLKKACRPTNK